MYNEAPSDIAYKIAIRASFLLGLTRKNSPEVFREVKKLYTIRNKIVHGQMGLPTFEDIQKIMEYARLSIICFCLLCSRLNTKKEKLIKEIDEAIIDENKRKLISKHLAGLKDFDARGFAEEKGKWRIGW